MSLQEQSRECPMCHRCSLEHTEAEINACWDAHLHNDYLEKVTRELRLSGRVSSQFGKHTFDKWVFDDEKQKYKTLQECKEWHFSKDTALYLYGSCGTGKTFAARCILFQAMQGGNTVAEVTAYDLLKRALRFEGMELTRQYEAAKYLLIDDFDKPNWDEKATAYIWQLFNTRAENGGRTILTSNFEPKNLRDIFAGQTGGNDTTVESMFQRLHPVTSIEIAGTSRR